MLPGDIQERDRIQRQNNTDYIREIWNVSGYPITELIRKFEQGYTLVSPVQQHRNIRNSNEALALESIIEVLNDYVDCLRAESNYQDHIGSKEDKERAYDNYVALRNFEIKMKDILRNYGINPKDFIVD